MPTTKNILVEETTTISDLMSPSLEYYGGILGSPKIPKKTTKKVGTQFAHTGRQLEQLTTE